MNTSDYFTPNERLARKGARHSNSMACWQQDYGWRCRSHSASCLYIREIRSANWIGFGQGYWYLYPISPHKEALRVLLFMYSNACIKTFINQCITSIQKSQCKDQTAAKPAEEIIGFLKTNEELVSRFSAVLYGQSTARNDKRKIYTFVSAVIALYMLHMVNRLPSRPSVSGWTKWRKQTKPCLRSDVTVIEIWLGGDCGNFTSLVVIVLLAAKEPLRKMKTKR